MKALPKVVQWQLQRTSLAPALPHPDTDRLTAFIEQSLPRTEGESVLEHLAQCSECRQIAALAESPVPLLAVKLRSARSWRPVLAWGGVAAVALVVGTLLLFNRANQHEPVAEAMRQQPVITAQNSGSVSHDVVHEKALETTLEPGVTAESRAADLKAARKKTANMLQNQDAAPGMARDSLPQALQNVAAAKAAKDESANAASPGPIGGPIFARRRAAPASANGASASDMRESFAASASKTAVPTGNIDDRYPRWTLNSDGILLRSLDTGASWQKISIPGNAALLHSIATVGTEVWVGGAGGALYHSADEGAHWLQVNPANGGALLADDVISIEFATAQRGKFVTSKQEVWTTADGGQTWSKK
jgi:hypothetical protein